MCFSNDSGIRAGSSKASPDERIGTQPNADKCELVQHLTLPRTTSEPAGERDENPSLPTTKKISMNQKFLNIIYGAATVVLGAAVIYFISGIKSEPINNSKPISADQINRNPVASQNNFTANQAPCAPQSESQKRFYENSSMKIAIPAGWSCYPTKSGALNITKGNYILYVNPATAQASGIIGGRFAEIAMGAPSADAVVTQQPSPPCGTSETHSALTDHPRTDLYVDNQEKQPWCSVPSNGSVVWYFSYITDKSGSYFNYYSKNQERDVGYVITMAYNSKDVNKLPAKGSAELNTTLSEMTDIVRTFQIK